MKNCDKITQIWNDIDHKRPYNIKKSLWRQSYEGVIQALQYVRLSMITSQDEFYKLHIPYLHKKYYYMRRKIVVSRYDGIKSKPTPIESLLIHTFSRNYYLKYNSIFPKPSQQNIQFSDIISTSFNSSFPEIEFNDVLKNFNGSTLNLYNDKNLNDSSKNNPLVNFVKNLDNSFEKSLDNSVLCHSIEENLDNSVLCNSIEKNLDNSFEKSLDNSVLCHSIEENLDNSYEKSLDNSVLCNSIEKNLEEDLDDFSYDEKHIEDLKNKKISCLKKIVDSKINDINSLIKFNNYFIYST